MRLSWQYIAGFFDGEGCITTSAGVGSRITITQAGDEGLRILTLIREFSLSYGVTSRVKSKKVSQRHKPCWLLVVSDTNSCIAFLYKMIPYLHVKKVLAEDKVRFLKWYAVNRRLQNAINGPRLAAFNSSPAGIARAKKPNAGQFKPGHPQTRWLSKEKEHVQ